MLIRTKLIACLLTTIVLGTQVLGAQAVFPPNLIHDTGLTKADVMPVWPVAGGIPDTRAKKLYLGDLKLWYAPDVTDYGAVCNGSTDDTTAFAAAVTALPATGGAIVLPTGTCVISSLTLNKAIRLIGKGGSTLKTNSATADLLTVTSFGVIIENLTFGTTVTRTAGAYIKATVGSLLIRNFYMTGQWIGIDITGGSTHRIQVGSIRNGATGAGTAGIKIEGGADTYLSLITMDHSVPYPAAGVWITATGDVNMTDCDIIHSTDDLLITGGFSIWVQSTFLDTATHGIHVRPDNPVGRIRFVGDWTASHTGDGVWIEAGSSTAVDIAFSAHHAFFNGGNGMNVATGGGLHVSGSQIQGNTAAGVVIGSSISDWSLVGNTIGSTTATNGNAGNGTYGLIYPAGTANNVVITGNALTGNTSGATSGTLSGSNNAVSGNSPSSMNTLVLNAAQLPNPSASTLGGIESLAAVSSNWINAISTSGVPTATRPAFSDISGTASAAQLPTPTSSTLGGTKSYAAVSSQWLRQLDTTGTFTSSQPAFSDISGSLAAAQLPNPSSSTLGGVQSLAVVASKWLNTISTSGIPAATQPAFTDISGAATTAQIPAQVFVSAGSSVTNSANAVSLISDNGSAANFLATTSRSGGSANVGDTAGLILRYLNSAAAVKNAFSLSASFTNVTAGTEASDVLFKEMIGGSLTQFLSVTDGHFVAGPTLIPTIACTGTGTSPAAPTIVGDDKFVTITMNTGTGAPANTGTCTITFAKAYAIAPSLVCMLGDGASAWSNEAVIRQSTYSTTAPVVTWTNEATGVLTGLVVSSSYKINCFAMGR